MFTVAMLYKSQNPHAPHILLVIDEAAQLGRSDALMLGFTYGRGAGVRTLALFQDSGQVVEHYGKSGLQTLIGSAQTRIWFGIRDAETADLVSRMLGTETLEYDDELARGSARSRKQNAARQVLMGGDPFALAQDLAQHARASRHQAKQARQLLTVDEALNLPEDHAVVFVSGKNLRPFLVGKYPYYIQRFMAGKYLPNPYHPPLDRVRVATGFGSKWVRVKERSVPKNRVHLPQYASGKALCLEGYPI